MKLGDAANLAGRVPGIPFDHDLSQAGVRPSINNEAQRNALMRRIQSGVHTNRRLEISALGEQSLHALHTGSYQVLIELLPELQLAGVHHLVRSGRTRRSVYDHAANKQLLVDDKNKIQRMVRIRSHFGSDRAKASRRKQLLDAGTHAGAIKSLAGLNRD